MSSVPDDVTGEANPIPREKLILTDSALAENAEEIIKAANAVANQLSSAMPGYDYQGGSSYRSVDNTSKAAAIRGGLYEFLFRFLNIVATEKDN